MMRVLIASLFAALLAGIVSLGGGVEPHFKIDQAHAQIGPLVGYGPLPFATVPIGSPATVVAFGSGLVNTSSFTATTSAAITAHNLVIVCVYSNNSNTISVSSLSDGTNSYTLAKAIQNAAYTGTDIEEWYVANASAVSSGATITATMSGSSGVTTGYVILSAQVSGILASGALDKTTSAQGTGSSLTMTTATLTKANEIAIGCSSIMSAETYSGASGFTNLNTGAATSNGSAWLDYDKVSATTGVTYAPAWATSSFRVQAIAATYEGH